MKKFSVNRNEKNRANFYKSSPDFFSLDDLSKAKFSKIFSGKTVRVQTKISFNFNKPKKAELFFIFPYNFRLCFVRFLIGRKRFNSPVK